MSLITKDRHCRCTAWACYADINENGNSEAQVYGINEFLQTVCNRAANHHIPWEHVVSLFCHRFEMRITVQGRKHHFYKCVNDTVLLTSREIWKRKISIIMCFSSWKLCDLLVFLCFFFLFFFRYFDI